MRRITMLPLGKKGKESEKKREGGVILRYIVASQYGST